MAELIKLTSEVEAQLELKSVAQSIDFLDGFALSRRLQIQQQQLLLLLLNGRSVGFGLHLRGSDGQSEGVSFFPSPPLGSPTD